MPTYLNEAVASICESIRFDSAMAEGVSGKPFGTGPYDCLHHFLSLARSLGFETKDYDGYIGEVVYGEGEEEFAILCHLDVVPAGNGWTVDPFGGVVRDGKIWGRGAVDDKGPAVCCLYALKALKDRGFTPSKKIKLLLGCNEESGWACIEHYKSVAHMPDEGFSPDGEFPVIYAEKGILHVRMHFPLERTPFLAFAGGTSANMVCDTCRSTPRSIGKRRAEALGLEVQGKALISHGKSAHASTPDEGENAIRPMLEYFAPKNEGIAHILDCLFYDKYRLKDIRDETGRLTLSPDIIRCRKKDMQVLVDIRYPATVPVRVVHDALARFGVKYETVHHQEPICRPKDGETIKTLLSVYEECTGTKSEPIAIGGGTYARALPFGVAFGPEMPGDEPIVHQPDEYITVERVKLLLEIYEKAIERLTK